MIPERAVIFLLGIVVVYGNAQSRDIIEPVHSIPLGSEASFHWRINPTKEIVQIEAHFYAEDNSWFAIGFSDYGETKPADYCVLWTDWRREVHLQDVWASEDGKLELDTQQDCDNFAWKKFGNLTKFTFTRKFDTCDKHDYVIERGTTHVVWLKGRGPLYSLGGLVTTDATTSGMTRMEMLRIARDEPRFPHDAWKFEILNDRVGVPNVETTYWCRVKKLPDALKLKHHVLQFGPVISKENEHLVHHMEVFHCAGPADFRVPSYNGPCESPNRPEATKICKKVLAAWAMGADAFVYPEEVGLSVGGEGFNPFVMLEVHYNNPDLESGKIDSSGIRFHLTKTLRQYDAGVMELGLEYTDKMAIPPLQESFELSGHCIAECTGVGLPQSGIHVFASQLHTHLTGTRVITRHIRDGEELQPLNYDDHYSTHFQEIRLLPKRVTVLPGDSLVTSCTYKTLDRRNVTLGGFAISDEMCVNYIHYYPRARLEIAPTRATKFKESCKSVAVALAGAICEFNSGNQTAAKDLHDSLNLDFGKISLDVCRKIDHKRETVCKSAISDDALRTYFRYMREWENQKTSENQGISTNYNSIEWTRVRVAALHDLYLAAPLGMQCNASDGSRLPGLWDNIAATPIRLPLAPRSRDCSDSAEVSNSMPTR